MLDNGELLGASKAEKGEGMGCNGKLMENMTFK